MLEWPIFPRITLVAGGVPIRRRREFPLALTRVLTQYMDTNTFRFILGLALLE
jgi:hypothetical protein